MMLGNLSIKEIEKRLGIDFPIECINFMQKTKQETATNIKKNKWHCFDIPFVLVCGNIEIAQKIYDYLLPLTKKMKTQLQISIQNNLTNKQE